jgi:hypothetical protein
MIQTNQSSPQDHFQVAASCNTLNTSLYMLASLQSESDFYDLANKLDVLCIDRDIPLANNIMSVVVFFFGSYIALFFITNDIQYFKFRDKHNIVSDSSYTAAWMSVMPSGMNSSLWIGGTPFYNASSLQGYNSCLVMTKINGSWGLQARNCSLPAIYNTTVCSVANSSRKNAFILI